MFPKDDLTTHDIAFLRYFDVSDHVCNIIAPLEHHLKFVYSCSYHYCSLANSSDVYSGKRRFRPLDIKAVILYNILLGNDTNKEALKI